MQINVKNYELRPFGGRLRARGKIVQVNGLEAPAPAKK